jgi:hypothetical protein
VRDIVDLYLNPPNRALVLCVDEKSQIQALDRTAPLLTWAPDSSNVAATTTYVTVLPACSPLSTWPAAACWDNSIVVIAR